MLTPIPEGFQLEDRGHEVVISHRWFSITYLGTLAFSLFWNGFLVAWYSLLPELFDSEGTLDTFVVIFYAFPLLHVSVGVGLLYYSLCGLLNTTTITVTTDRIVVRIAPLPWAGSKTWTAADIEQFYTQERRSYSRNSGMSLRYDVKAMMKSKKSYTFLPNLKTKEEGLFIEKTLEDRLFIQDQAVAGEVEK